MDAGELDGRTGIVVGGSGIGHAIVRSLECRGANVAVVDLSAPGTGTDRSDGSAFVADADFRDVDSIADAFRACARMVGPVSSAVWAHADRLALSPRPLVEIDESEWKRRSEEQILAAIACAQAAREAFDGRGGQLVFVVPTIGITGAAGLAPDAAAAEGIKLAAKSAARQWGVDGIVAYCVAVPIEAYRSPGEEYGSQLAMVTPFPAALGRWPDRERDLGDVISLLLEPRAHFLTGSTFSVDGGVLLQ